MLQHRLDLPVRATKPRDTGLTMVIDNGLSLAEFSDAVSSNAALIDVVKFGWGTALVTATIEGKMAVLREHGIDFYFGGTLFEKHVQQGRFEDFVALCSGAGLTTVEVSNGTLPMSNEEKGSWIRKLAVDFTVISEVGFKQSAQDATMTPAMWGEFVAQDLAAGASRVITEARESGTSGIADASGGTRGDIVDAVLAAAPAERLIFEAPTKSLQTYLIATLGADVNLGNIAPRDLVSLETPRLGLRSDTFFTFGQGAST